MEQLFSCIAYSITLLPEMSLQTIPIHCYEAEQFIPQSAYTNQSQMEHLHFDTFWKCKSVHLIIYS